MVPAQKGFLPPNFWFVDYAPKQEECKQKSTQQPHNITSTPFSHHHDTRTLAQEYYLSTIQTKFSFALFRIVSDVTAQDGDAVSQVCPAEGQHAYD